MTFVVVILVVYLYFKLLERKKIKNYIKTSSENKSVIFQFQIFVNIWRINKVFLKHLIQRIVIWTFCSNNLDILSILKCGLCFKAWDNSVKVTHLKYSMISYFSWYCGINNTVSTELKHCYTSCTYTANTVIGTSLRLPYGSASTTTATFTKQLKWTVFLSSFASTTTSQSAFWHISTYAPAQWWQCVNAHQ